MKSRKELSGDEGGKSVCSSGEKKASVRKETDAVSVTEAKRAQTREHTAATPSESTASRGRSVSKEVKHPRQK